MPSLAQRQIYRAAMQVFAERGMTQISVTDLAQAAGVARGTIYNNLDDLSGLFDLVASDLAAELKSKMSRALEGLDDPVVRLATGIRLMIRCAHAEPQLGRFICRFGLSTATTRVVRTGQPMDDLVAGLAAGRYRFDEQQLPTVVHFILGATLGAMVATLDGVRTWPEAAAETVEWVLVALGVSRSEARVMATGDLPPFPD